MDDVHELLQGLQARRSGSGWMARCPAHEDRNPSLSISIGQDGQILVHCHAGCKQTDVIAALRDRDLWKENHQPERVITATYDYTDEDGQLLYQVVRYVPKDFKQRRPDGAGGWIWRKGDRQVLYHLPEVLEAPIVFIVEGEKDVEALRMGLLGDDKRGRRQGPLARQLHQDTPWPRMHFGSRIMTVPGGSA